MSDLLQNFTGEIEIKSAPPELLKCVQEELNRSGYFLNTDGFFGPKTSAAFNQFKKDHFLAGPGVLGKSTADALLAAIAPPRTKDDHIRLILSEASKQGVSNHNQLAYILATVRHETDQKYEPIDEYGGASTRYAPFWGRGYVQLTWYDNYLLYSKLTGKNLVRNPEQAKNPFTAAFVLIHGFRTGSFTGKAIGNYISAQKCDFINARRCINSTDKASLIAGYAEQWLSRVKEFA